MFLHEFSEGEKQREREGGEREGGEREGGEKGGREGGGGGERRREKGEREGEKQGEREEGGGERVGGERAQRKREKGERERERGRERCEGDWWEKGEGVVENINSQVPHNGLFITLVTKTQITVHKLPQTYHRRCAHSTQSVQTSIHSSGFLV